MSELKVILTEDLKQASVAFKNLTESQVSSLETYAISSNEADACTFCRLLVYRCDAERLLKYYEYENLEIQCLCRSLLRIKKIQSKMVENIHSADDLIKYIEPHCDNAKSFIIKSAMKIITDEHFFETIYESNSSLLSKYRLKSVYKTSPTYYIKTIQDEFAYVYVNNQYKQHYQSEKVLQLIIEDVFSKFNAISNDSSEKEVSDSLDQTFRMAPWLFKTILFKQVTFNNETKLGFNFFIDILKKFSTHQDHVKWFYSCSFSTIESLYDKGTSELPPYNDYKLQLSNSNVYKMSDLFKTLIYIAPLYLIKTLDIFTSNTSNDCSQLSISLDKFVNLYYFFKSNHQDEYISALLSHFSTCFFKLIESMELYVDSPYDCETEQNYLKLKTCMTKEDLHTFVTLLIKDLIKTSESIPINSKSINSYLKKIYYIYGILNYEGNDYIDQNLHNLLQTFCYRLNEVRTENSFSASVTVSIYALLDKVVPFNFFYNNGNKEMKTLYPEVYEFEKFICSKSNGFLCSKDSNIRSKTINAIFFACFHVQDIGCTQRVLQSIFRLFIRDKDLFIDYKLYYKSMNPFVLGFNRDEKSVSLSNTKTNHELLSNLLEELNSWAGSIPSTISGGIIPTLLRASIVYSCIYAQYSSQYVAVYQNILKLIFQLNLDYCSSFDYNYLRMSAARIEFNYAFDYGTLSNHFYYKVLHAQEEAIEKNLDYPQYRNGYYYPISIVCPVFTEYDYIDYYPSYSVELFNVLNTCILDYTQKADVFSTILYDLENSVFNQKTYEKSQKFVTLKDNIQTTSTVSLKKVPKDHESLNQWLTMIDQSPKAKEYCIPGYSVYMSYLTRNNRSSIISENETKSSVKRSINFYDTKKSLKSLNEEYVNPQEEAMKTLQEKNSKYSKKCQLSYDSTIGFKLNRDLVLNTFNSKIENINSQLSTIIDTIPSLSLSESTNDWFCDNEHNVFDFSNTVSLFGISSPLHELYKLNIPADVVLALYSIAVKCCYFYIEAIYFRIYYFLYDEDGKQSTYDENYHDYLYTYICYVLNLQKYAAYANIELPIIEKSIFVYSDIVAENYGIQLDEGKQTTDASVNVNLTDINELLKVVFISFSSKTIQDIFAPHVRKSRRGAKCNPISNLISNLYMITDLLPKNVLIELYSCFLSTSSGVSYVHSVINDYLQLTTHNSTYINTMFEILIPKKEAPISVQYVSLLFAFARHPIIHNLLRIEKNPIYVKQWNDIINRLWSNRTLARETCFYLINECFDEAWSDSTSLSTFEKITKMTGKNDTENFFLNSFLYLSSIFFPDVETLISPWVSNHFSDVPKLMTIFNELKTQYKSKLSTSEADYIRQEIKKTILSLVSIDLKDTKFVVFSYVSVLFTDQESLVGEVELAKRIMMTFLFNDNSYTITQLLSAIRILINYDINELISTLTQLLSVYKVVSDNCVKDYELSQKDLQTIESVMTQCDIKYGLFLDAQSKHTFDSFFNLSLPSQLLLIIQYYDDYTRISSMKSIITSFADCMKSTLSLFTPSYLPYAQLYLSMFPYLSPNEFSSSLQFDVQNYLKNESLDTLPVSYMYTLIQKSHSSRIGISNIMSQLIDDYNNTHSTTSAFLICYFITNRNYNYKVTKDTLLKIIYKDSDKFTNLQVFYPIYLEIIQ